jgi:phenylalanyl-tRNA synthetase beta chain
LPVIRLSTKRLFGLLGREIEETDLERLLMRVKGEVEGAGNGYIEVEINSDRLDMMISEGVARTLKGLLGIEVGLPRYLYKSSGHRLEVKDVPQRPYIAMAIIRGIRSSDEFIEELIQFQEKLHMTIGRKRRKVAIGLHDLSKVPGRECMYRELEHTETFAPLGYSRSLKVEEILRVTEQGRLYGHISNRDGRVPGIVCGGEVISMPPVINSEPTRITNRTRDLLIDVTGTDLGYVLKTLEILSTTIAEGTEDRAIERVSIHAPWGDLEAPVGEVRKMVLDVGWASSLIGLEGLGVESISRFLEEMRYGVKPLGREVEVYIPSYRIDVIEPVDLVEDIAVAIDLNKISPEPLQITLPGRLHHSSILRRVLRDIMTGLGFTEVYRHVLVPEQLLRDLGFTDFLKIRNPVSSEMSAARPSIIISILITLSATHHSPKPIKIYEIGDIVVRDPTTYTGWRTGLSMAASILDYEVSFEDIQAPLFSMLRSLGLSPRTRSRRHPLFIDGRSAEIIVNGRIVGVVGEIRLEVLKKMEIDFPVAAFEVDLKQLINTQSMVEL